MSAIGVVSIEYNQGMSLPPITPEIGTNRLLDNGGKTYNIEEIIKLSVKDKDLGDDDKNISSYSLDTSEPQDDSIIKLKVVFNDRASIT